MFSSQLPRNFGDIHQAKALSWSSVALLNPCIGALRALNGKKSLKIKEDDLQSGHS
jgi:hypothetical protein